MRILLLSIREGGGIVVEDFQVLADGRHGRRNYREVLAQAAQHAKIFMAGGRIRIVCLRADMSSKIRHDPVGSPEQLQHRVGIARVARVPEEGEIKNKNTTKT